jgi:uncharacterized LabA/DUF88 family protein
MPEDLAIFIDWENIYISTVSEYNSKPNVSAILEKSREYGRIVSATAYADWTDGDFRDAPPTLYSNGISPRYISARYFPGGKSQKRRTNSIDVMLAVECSDFLHTHPQVDTYVLVTGDGDFIPLVTLLRSRGKKVVVIGVSEATSYHLIESADDFISYASLLEEERAARARDKGPKKKAADPFKELVRAVETLKKGGKTRVLGQVKQQMIVQLGSFDETSSSRSTSRTRRSPSYPNRTSPPKSRKKTVRGGSKRSANRRGRASTSSRISRLTSYAPSPAAWPP